MNPTAETYLASLPEDRREAIAALRHTILEHLHPGFEETATGGMLLYQVPLSRYPNTYNKQPLQLAALASQKNHLALYLTVPYMSETALEHLKTGFARAGKKLDMGKSCVRFKTLEDAPLGVIGEHVQAVTVERFIELYENTRHQ